MQTRRRTLDSTRKIYAGGALADWLGQFARPLVFTNGCFDLLHRGHVHLLEHAAQLGNALIVGVNSDASVRALDKDASRPINPLPDRMACLAALAAVDGVIEFDAPTPLELILQIKPEHLVKGGDWQPDQIVGGAQVNSWGGRVTALPFKYSRSTTALLARIRAFAQSD